MWRQNSNCGVRFKEVGRERKRRILLRSDFHLSLFKVSPQSRENLQVDFPKLSPQLLPRNVIHLPPSFASHPGPIFCDIPVRGFFFFPLLCTYSSFSLFFRRVIYYLFLLSPLSFLFCVPSSGPIQRKFLQRRKKRKGTCLSFSSRHKRIPNE